MRSSIQEKASIDDDSQQEQKNYFNDSQAKVLSSTDDNYGKRTGENVNNNN